MSLDRLLTRLQEVIGLDPESIGLSAIEAAITVRQRAVGLARRAEYLSQVEGSPAEFSALVEEIVVPETWFFRGGEVFAFLANRIRETAAQRRRPCRVLSIPCSSGEELYSLAIALAELDVNPAAYELLGVDLSARLVEKARRGRFTEFSFREIPDPLRTGYFTPVENGWELCHAVRARAAFAVGNLLDPRLLIDGPLFDVILCRNLLIYFHTAARRQALEHLGRLLIPDGLICTGPAEAISYHDQRFRRIGLPEFFLFQRTDSSEPGPVAPPPAQWRPRPLPLPPATAPVPIAPRRHAESAVAPQPAPPVVIRAEADPLSAARQKADAGELPEALSICRAQLATAGASADLLSLMGVIYRASREDSHARACFQKALYLEPDHRDALLHLLLLHREHGEQERAELLRRRLERLGEGGDR